MADGIDPAYEFEAPQFHDFAEGEQPHDLEADSWFDNKRRTPARKAAMPKVAEAEKEENPNGKRRKVEGEAPKPIIQKELTVPKSPKFSKIERQRTLPKSREAQELEAIEQARLEVEKQKARNEKSLKKAFQHQGTVIPSRSTKPLTEPQEFHFETEKRLRKEEEESNANTNEHPMTLRSAKKAAASEQRINGITVVKPFKLSEGKKADIPDQKVEPFVSMQQAVESFQKKTPARFRSKSARQNVPILSQDALKTAHELTQPVPFTFRSDARVRGVQALSQEEREAEEMKKIPKFTARKLDRRILDSCGDLGVPKIPRAAATVPKGFDFKTDARAAAHPAPEVKEEAVFVFKANPLPKTPKQGKQASGAAVTKKALTVPQTPNFASKALPKKDKTAAAAAAEVKAAFKARPLPDFKAATTTSRGAVGRMERAHAAKSAKSKPFALRTEERGKVYNRRTEDARKLAREKARQEADFHARPIPSFDYVPVPLGDVHLTEVQPFHLQSELRHAAAQKVLQEKKEEEEWAAKEAAEFHARPMDIERNFHPRKSTRPLTVVSAFQLNSDVRSSQRSAFDAHMKEKAEQIAAMEAQKNQARLEAEEAERLALRKTMTFKAGGIRRGKAVDVQKSSKPLTEPFSPALRTRSRAANRALKAI
jgi:targeting protein for Xklp2